MKYTEQELDDFRAFGKTLTEAQRQDLDRLHPPGCVWFCEAANEGQWCCIDYIMGRDQE